MSWFRIDDGFADHPKMIALRGHRHWKGAVCLWTMAGSYCSKHLTDGIVSDAVLAYLGGTPAEAEALVAVGLWTRVEGGYAFHQWGERNPLRAKVLADRAADAERKRKGGRERSARTPTGIQAEATPESAPESTPDSAAPDPARPDPARPLATLAETARAPDGVLEASVDLDDRARKIRGLIVAAYARQWHTDPSRGPWPGPGRAAGDLDALARALARRDDGEAYAERAVEGFFRSPDTFVRKARWPLALLARDPGRYADGGGGYARPAPASAFTTTDPQPLFPEDSA